MKRTLALLIVTAAWGPQASRGQPPSRPPTAITLRPAPPPRPALKYRLAPERRTLVPGNAAIFYHRALLFVAQSRAENHRVGNGEVKAPGGESPEEQISRWVSGPIRDIPSDQARARLVPFQNALKEVELAARRSTCDWEYDRREEGIYLLMPELQDLRGLARLVSLKAKLAILDGKIDEALHWIEIGFVMGRHAAEGPTLIQALVGVAIDFVMERCLEDAIQVPGTPSLYWALADRPRPFIDLRRPLEGERYLLEKELPELGELERGPWSLDEARRFSGELQRRLFNLVGGGTIPGTDTAFPQSVPDMARRVGIAAMAAKIYPEAKRGLLARGMAPAEVEAMPVVQVSVLHSIREYERLRDDTYKWMNLPYWQSYGRSDSSGLFGQKDKTSNPLLTLFGLVTPALNSARVAALRLERQLDALECIEAIRLHAAGHGGDLPANLDDITDAPVPFDPATGKPFLYKADGGTATLSAPTLPGGPNHPAYAISYTLKLSR